MLFCTWLRRVQADNQPSYAPLAKLANAVLHGAGDENEGKYEHEGNLKLPRSSCTIVKGRGGQFLISGQGEAQQQPVLCCINLSKSMSFKLNSFAHAYVYITYRKPCFPPNVCTGLVYRICVQDLCTGPVYCVDHLSLITVHGVLDICLIHAFFQWRAKPT